MASDNAGDRIVDERVKIFDARRRELFLVFRIKNIVENIFEAVVVGFGNGVFRCKPQVELHVKSVVKAASCKTFDALIGVVHAKHDARGLFKIENFDTFLFAVLSAHDDFGFVALLHVSFDVAIYVAVRVTRNNDGACPGRDKSTDAVNDNRASENGAVQNRTNRAVGAFPHFFKVIFFHALGVGGDRSALDRNAVFFRGVRGV